MRAVWWCLKLGWRTGVRVRRFFGPSMPAEHPTEWMTHTEPGDVMGGPLEVPPTVTPIGNLHDLLEGVPGRSVDRELERLDELARKGR
jgi:hypothetical protein